MKKIKIVIVLVVFIFSACSKDEIIKEEPISTEKPTENEGVLREKSALIINGTPYYAGIGYSATQDRLFRPAIDSFDMLQSTDIPLPLDLNVDVIETDEELEWYMRKTESRNVNFLFKIFGFGKKTKKVIEERIKVDEDHLTVIGRISIQRYRYLTDGDPFLTDQAEQFIADQRFGDFLRKFGPMYVESQVLGGDVYFVYNYDVTEFSKTKKSSFRRNIKANVQDYFGLEVDKVLTNEEKLEISNSVETYTVATNIIGFSPTLINDTGQISAEITRIQNYLTANPELAASMEMELRSYSNVLDLVGLRQLYNKEAKCYSDWENWSVLESKIEFVYNNSLNTNLRNDAYGALSIIQENINNSLNCSNSITPSPNEFKDIIDAYEEEKLNREIQKSRTNIYLYNWGMRKVELLPYVADRPGASNAYVGNTFSWLTDKFPGTKALYKYTNWRDGSIRYSLNPSAINEYDQEIAGYLYSNQVQGTVPLYYWVYTQHPQFPMAFYEAYYVNVTPQPDYRLLGYVFLPK